jgi:hypothetical protein
LQTYYNNLFSIGLENGIIHLPLLRPPDELMGFERNKIREEKKKSPYFL